MGLGRFSFQAPSVTNTGCLLESLILSLNYLFDDACFGFVLLLVEGLRTILRTTAPQLKIGFEMGRRSIPTCFLLVENPLKLIECTQLPLQRKVRRDFRLLYIKEITRTPLVH